MQVHDNSNSSSLSNCPSSGGVVFDADDVHYLVLNVRLVALEEVAHV